MTRRVSKPLWKSNSVYRSFNLEFWSYRIWDLLILNIKFTQYLRVLIWKVVWIWSYCFNFQQIYSDAIHHFRYLDNIKIQTFHNTSNYSLLITVGKVNFVRSITKVWIVLFCYHIPTFVTQEPSVGLADTVGYVWPGMRRKDGSWGKTCWRNNAEQREEMERSPESLSRLVGSVRRICGPAGRVFLECR